MDAATAQPPREQATTMPNCDRLFMSVVAATRCVPEGLVRVHWDTGVVVAGKHVLLWANNPNDCAVSMQTEAATYPDGAVFARGTMVSLQPGVSSQVGEFIVPDVGSAASVVVRFGARSHLEGCYGVVFECQHMLQVSRTAA
jgi:hypothetical protein